METEIIEDDWNPDPNSTDSILNKFIVNFTSIIMQKKIKKNRRIIIIKKIKKIIIFLSSFFHLFKNKYYFSYRLDFLYNSYSNFFHFCLFAINYLTIS